MKIGLYNKYRPDSINDLVGQEIPKETIKTAIEDNKVSHAYIFTGPHGVGKTTLARILAKEVNGVEEYNGEDIIEIDAATNGGVDSVRKLTAMSAYKPVDLKYRVIIIDEVHMFSTQAWNALLKTIEEPVPTTKFILVTTEFQKIPDTIVSRCQVVNFEPVDYADMEKLIESISDKEGFEVEPEAKMLVHEWSGGSPRDAIKLLEQAAPSNKGKLTVDRVSKFINIPSALVAQQIVNYTYKGETRAAVVVIEKEFYSGKNARDISQAVLFELSKRYKKALGNREVEEHMSILTDAFSKAYTGYINGFFNSPILLFQAVTTAANKINQPQ